MQVSRFLVSPFSITSSAAAILLVFCSIAFASTTKLLSSDIAAGDWFGDAVAIDGNTAVIAAYKHDSSAADDGAAYIFDYSSSTWSQSAKLVANDGAAGDLFGFSADIDGNTVIIGAIEHDSSGTNSGAGYVFVRNGGAWTQQAKLVASDAGTADYLGYAASISGNLIALGASYDGNSNGSNGGAVYVFNRINGSWAEEQKIIAPDGGADDQFGNTVSLYGNTLLIGARNNNGKGAAYVYTRSGSTWSLEQKITSSDGASGDSFGLSAALEGNRLVVSAPQDDDGFTDTGSLYVYSRSGSTWTQEAKLTATDAELGDRLGLFTIGFSGDYIAAASPWSNGNGSNSGATYLFQRIGGSWTQIDKIVGDDVTADDWFGIASNVHGDWVLMGAEHSSSVSVEAGSAYIYSISGNSGSGGDDLPEAPTTVSPTGSITDDTPEFIWSEAGGADYYQLSVQDSSNDTIIYDVNVDVGDFVCDGMNCVSTPDESPLAPGSYKWYVRAWNSVGSSDWTAGQNFSVSGSDTNAPPEAPTTVSPTGSIANDSPEFVWSEASGADYYQLFVYHPSSATTIYNININAGKFSCDGTNCVSTPDELPLALGSYKWYVRAWNSVGSSDWTAGQNFSVISSGGATTPPEVPTTVSPAGSIANDSPEFVWSEASGADYYQLFVYHPNSATTIYNINISVGEFSCDGTNCVSTPDELPLALGSYKWYVRAWNSVGSSDWTAGQNFSVISSGGATTPPEAPTTISPTGSITSDSPEFAWTDAVDAEYYQLSVYHPSSATTIYNINVGAGEFSCDGTNCVSTPDELPLASGSYKWYVRAWNSVGSSDWTPSRNFSVITSGGATSPPETPATVSPTGSITSDSPEFTWSDAVDAEYYQLSVYHPSSGTTIYNIIVDAGEFSCDGTNCVSTPDELPLAPGSYKWYVRAWNSVGSSDWTPSRNFSVISSGGATTPPEAPTTITPTSSITDDTPEFVWSEAVGAEYYQLMVYHPSSATTIYNINVDAGEFSCNGTNCVSTPNELPLASGSYKWYIRAWNSMGSSDWTAGRNFSVSTSGGAATSP